MKTTNPILALLNNLVEAHCYVTGMAGQFFSTHVAVKQVEMKDVLTVKVFVSYNAFHCIVCIQCIVTDEDLRGRNTFISICIELHCIVCIQCIVADEDLCGQNVFQFVSTAT